MTPIKNNQNNINSLEEKQFIVTPAQMAKIVTYCLKMTVVGDRGKNWTPNVLEAIDEVKTKTVISVDKIELDDLQSLVTTHEQQARRELFDWLDQKAMKIHAVDMREFARGFIAGRKDEFLEENPSAE